MRHPTRAKPRRSRIRDAPGDPSRLACLGDVQIAVHRTPGRCGQRSCSGHRAGCLYAAPASSFLRSANITQNMSAPHLVVVGRLGPRQVELLPLCTISFCVSFQPHSFCRFMSSGESQNGIDSTRTSYGQSCSSQHRLADQRFQIMDALRHAHSRYRRAEPGREMSETAPEGQTLFQHTCRAAREGEGERSSRVSR